MCLVDGRWGIGDCNCADICAKHDTEYPDEPSSPDAIR